MATDKRIGNQFWKLRSKHGRDKLFKTPKLLWDAACEYYEWCDSNPLKEQKAFHFQGTTSKENIDKMRAYTLIGLCLYLDCSENYFRNFEDNNKESKEFMAVITRIRETIYTQKFTGAAADLLNANIIARDLGLVDRKDIQQTNVNALEDKTDEELQNEIDKLTGKKD